MNQANLVEQRGLALMWRKTSLKTGKIDFSKIKEQENKKVVVERLAPHFEDCCSKFSSLREKASLTCSQALPCNE